MKKRAASPRPTEFQHQATVFDWVNKIGALQYPELKWLFAIPNGAHYGGGPGRFREAGRMKAAGLKSGIPDICLPVHTPTKAKSVFCALYIEMKRDAKAKLQPEQEAWRDYLNGAGYLAVVCRSASEAIETIIDYLEGRL